MAEEKIEKLLQTAAHFFKQGKLLQAKQLYNQVLQKDETNLEAIFEKGKIALEEKKFGEAVETFSHGSELQENLMEKEFPFKQFKAIAIINQENSDDQTALTLLQESLKSENGIQDEKLLLQATILFQHGKFEEALNLLRQTSQTFDKKKQALQLTALIFSKLGQEKNLEIILNKIGIKKLEPFEVKVDFVEKEFKFKPSY